MLISELVAMEAELAVLSPLRECCHYYGLPSCLFFYTGTWFHVTQGEFYHFLTEEVNGFSFTHWL